MNASDFPSVVPISGQHWAAHWLVKRPGGNYAYDIALAMSADGGKNWTSSNGPANQWANGINARTGDSNDAIPVFCLTIDPHDADILWAGTQHRRGVFRSGDGGATWSRRENGIVEDPPEVEGSFAGCPEHATAHRHSSNSSCRP